jgi:serine/threonine-protein kinase
MTTKTGTERPRPLSADSTIVTADSIRHQRAPESASGGGGAARAAGLGTKFFLAAALLLVAALGISIAFGSWRADQVAEKSIREGLKEIPDVFRSYKSSIENDLKGSVASVADEPGTKGLFDAQDPRTLHDWTDDKARKLSARTVFLFDDKGILLDRSDQQIVEENRRSFAGVRWVADPLAGGSASAVFREGRSLALVAAVPVISGDMSRGEGRLRGVLAAAVSLDEARAKALKGITGGQVAFVANTARRGEPPKPELASSTSGFRAEALLPALAKDPAAMDTLFSQGREIGPLDVPVDGDRRIVAAVPVKSASGETLGAFVVSRSREEETAAFRQIRTAILWIGVVVLLLALPVSFAMGRRIARPLEQLARGAVAIREGNLDVKLPEGGLDEVGALARAFSAMVGELREKAALEQMIADMRRHQAETTHATTVTVPSSGESVRTGGAGRGGPSVGALFSGRYRILSVLGKGGMGAVYRALDQELDDEIALKVLMPEAFDESSLAVQTLKQEIRLARKITHKNVVRTHDLGEADGVRFLTMEYVPGTTLREVIDRRGAVEAGVGLQIAKQLCRGLSAVHNAGIIHRDIKPPNIMVLPNGVVKLMDFGIARLSEGVDPDSLAGQTVGTPFYMSPEQAQGRDLDVRSDIYSVGVVLYELFTGVRPIEGRNASEVMRRHVSTEPERPTKRRPEMPEALEPILMACLSKKPDERPACASDLHGALMRVAA